jgi:hypothetical protein
MWCREHTMTEYPYILFNKSPEQLRHLGACGGRAYGRNQRARRALVAAPPEAVATRGVTANGRRSHPPSGHPVFRGCAVRKGNSRNQAWCPRARRERIKTSDSRGNQSRTSSLMPATTARRFGGGIRLRVGRLRAFG